jgi:hypothetical protein
MKNILTLIAIIAFGACTKQATVTPTTNAFLGTYIGTDSIQTYSSGVLVNTSVNAKSITVVNNTVAGRNAIIRNFITDSIEANFANNSIAIFPTFQPVANISGTYTTNTITTYYETGGGMGLQKVYSNFKKQ